MLPYPLPFKKSVGGRTNRYTLASLSRQRNTIETFRTTQARVPLSSGVPSLPGKRMGQCGCPFRVLKSLQAIGIIVQANRFDGLADPPLVQRINVRYTISMSSLANFAR